MKYFCSLLLIVATHSANAAPDTKSIALLTYIKLKPGTEAQFMEEFKKIITPSRWEPGNIAWYVQKSDEDPTMIVFYTRWVNEEALHTHLASPPLVEYIAKTAAMLEAGYPKFVRFHPIDDCSQCQDTSDLP